MTVDRQWIGLPSPSGVPRAGAGGYPCQGFYYSPAEARPKVAFIASHQNVDFSEHYLGQLLAQRGFGFLGWNTRFRGDESHFLTDHAIADIGAGMRWLRDVAHVERIVLLGNSGGGSLMATYQSQAHGITLEPAPGLKLSRGLDDLPTGDLFVALAAHPGRAHLFSSTMDPSVVDETDPVAIDPQLDMYNPNNGPGYSNEFQQRYREAQIARNRRITQWAFKELEGLKSSGTPATDRLFAVYRLWADLRFEDGDIDPNARALGTCWVGSSRRANYGVFGLGQVSTLRTWINLWSIDHSQCAGENHLPRVVEPALTIGADADTGIFPSDTAILHKLLGSKDKTVETLNGDHYFTQPGAREAVADCIASWVHDRT
ncbi:alpha/beta hydrolase family protein [Rhodococcus koreensis]